ncbi:MAG: hypothetical protein QOI59_3549 [Gammaproteobacteria bacterium]|jgi:hypothetical protein|nr:hypothetical protein [Gammaproteobacteria bacterium]
MTVPSGRARFGARSVLRAAFVGAAAILGLFGCGNNQFINGTPIITFSVTPGPFTSYLVEIDQIMLTRSDNTPVYPLLQPQLVDFTKLADMPEVFGSPAILEGTYTSAAITVNYGASLYQTAAQIFINQNGQSVAVTPLDSTGAAAGSVTYTVKFDPNHPLVIKRGVSVPLDFNFDLSAGSQYNGTTAVTVYPFITASTLPQYKTPLRARGVYVTTDTTNNNNFTMNARSFFDVQGSPVGAIEIQTNDNTTYNINGVAYKGAAGLAAVNALQINTIIEAYGTYGDLNNIKPNLVATEVYAGVAVENPLTDRITGTIASRSGNTLHIRGAEVEARNFNIPIGVAVSFQNDLTLTIGDTTLITVDGHPELQAVPLQYLSIGQQVDIEALLVVDANNIAILDANGNPQWDATSGLIRLTPTTGWATLDAAPAGSSVTANLVTLGGAQPAGLTFTGTGSATGADADPTQYAVDTTGVDTSTIASAPLFRFDGLVTQFGTAPPDFSAASVTPVAATDQIMTVWWTGTGTTAPFASKDANGLVVNISAGSLGSMHLVQGGPLTVAIPEATTDLATLPSNPTIVADPTLTSQFAIGNPTSTTGLSIFHDYASLLTNLNTALNGTNTIQKLVAVGKYDPTSNTFTAYRIDMLQLP